MKTYEIGSILCLSENTNARDCIVSASTSLNSGRSILNEPNSLVSIGQHNRH